MSAIIKGIIKELEDSNGKISRALERQSDLLEQLKISLGHDFESELQTKLNDLRTQLEQGD